MPNNGDQLPNGQIRVLIADDYPILRVGLKFFLLAYNDLNPVGEAADGIQAIALCRQLQPDVVLMDLLMPMMDGVRATQAIHQYCPRTRIIILTSSDSQNKLAARAVEEGATCCLSKNVSAQTLAEKIRDVMALG